MLSSSTCMGRKHTWIIEEKQLELVEELKTVELVEWDTSKTTKIGKTQSSAIANDLLSFFKENLDVFT